MKKDQQPLYLTPKEFREQIVNWSSQTIRRKVKEEGMPAVQQESGRYIFPAEEVKLWFKRRQVRAG